MQGVTFFLQSSRKAACAILCRSKVQQALHTMRLVLADTASVLCKEAAAPQVPQNQALDS